MNIDYLYSIIDLYIKNENDEKKTNLSVSKINNNIRFSFNMKDNGPDKTTFDIPIKVINASSWKFINYYKKELMVIDEKYTYNKNNNICNYYVEFKNGRVITFSNFNLLDINNIRNYLFNMKFNIQEIHVELNKEKEMMYKPQLKMQYAGFTSFKILLVSVLIFTNIFLISLLIFNTFIK